MSELSKLPNIGAVLAEKLGRAGINTIEDLDRLGSREAFIRLKTVDADAWVNSLRALEGAIRRIRWHDLPEETKKELKAFFISMK